MTYMNEPTREVSFITQAGDDGPEDIPWQTRDDAHIRIGHPMAGTGRGGSDTTLSLSLEGRAGAAERVPAQPSVGPEPAYDDNQSSCHPIPRAVCHVRVCSCLRPVVVCIVSLFWIISVVRLPTLWYVCLLALSWKNVNVICSCVVRFPLFF